jgi:cyanophycinase-like exopeptidase
MPSKTLEGEVRGWTVLIGAAENKDSDLHILERFVRASGGAAGKFALIAAALRTSPGEPRWAW